MTVKHVFQVVQVDGATRVAVSRTTYDLGTDEVLGISVLPDVDVGPFDTLGEIIDRCITSWPSQLAWF